MRAVYRRELRAWFRGVTGYVFIAFTLAVVGIYAAIINFGSGYANFEYALSASNFVFLLLIPILTMRSMAEEKRQKTDRLLLCLPLRPGAVMAGKYLAMVTMLALPTAVFCLYPPVLALYGHVSFASAYAALLAFFLLGCTLIAVGLFVSSLTENQLMAALVSFAVLLACYLMTALASYLPTSAYVSLLCYWVLALAAGGVVWFMTRSLPVGGLVFLAAAAAVLAVFLAAPASLEGSVQRLLGLLSVFDRQKSFTGGILDLEAVTYYVSLSGFFLYLSVRSLEKGRWS